MFAIAGGIILAVIILAFLPLIFRLGSIIIVGALVVGAGLLIFGTEAGRTIAAFVLFGGAALYGIYQLLEWGPATIGYLLNRTAKAFSRFWLPNILITLRPAVTEQQKIKKVAELAIMKAKFESDLRERERLMDERSAQRVARSSQALKERDQSRNGKKRPKLTSRI